ncbi:MAG: hypothetical protein KDC71_11885, partial [Acidobacteria bacterium]|nr:hypothetical protein [Acidobacteriota bacterium]
MGYPEIVVTGMGLVSSLGHDLETSWKNAISASDPFRPVPYFDASAEKSEMAAPLPSPPASDPRFPRSSRTDLMSLAAAQAAVQDSGLGPLISKAGLFLGAGTGGLHLTETCFAEWTQNGKPANIQDFYVHNGDATTQIVAESLGLEGPLRSVMTACSSSVLAMAEAIDQMRTGQLDICLVGGADAITRLTHAGFNSLSAVDP